MRSAKAHKYGRIPQRMAMPLVFVYIPVVDIPVVAIYYGRLITADRPQHGVRGDPPEKRKR